jgi:hypothetical protein
MASEPTQNLKNHARYVPLFHFVLGLLVFANLVHAVRVLVPFTPDRAYDAMVAAALALMFWYTRAFALTVQDRVIRLEERLRLQALAPELASRFDQLTIGQVVALRFAGDGEVAALLREVLEGRLTAPGDIKKAVKHWRADTLRA